MKMAPEDQLVVELDHQPILFNLQNNTLEPLENFDVIESDVWVISDFDDTPPRFMEVETPPKYAELLAQRQLQESGELEEGIHMIPHWKKERGKTASTVFFTAIPGKHYLTHESRASELDNHYLLIPCNALLLACLNQFTKITSLDKQKEKQERLAEETSSKKKKKSAKVCAILFEHGRHVDLLVGRSGQLLGASRVSSFSNAPDAKELLTNSVTAELQNILEHSTSQLNEIISFNWLLLEAGSDLEAIQSNHGNWITQLAEQLQTSVNILPPKLLQLSEENAILTSLPETLQYLTESDSTASTIEIMAYRSQQIMPWTLFIMIIFALGLGVHAYWLQMQQDTLQAEIDTLQSSASPSMPTKIKPLNDAYKEVVVFIKNLERWQRTSSYWMILSELSSARVPKLFFDQVTIEFDKNVRAFVTLKGAIESSFQTANKDHEIFLAELTKRNFKVVKSNFATDVTQLTFEIKLERQPK